MQEKKHPLELEVQFADPRLESEITEADLRRWVECSLLGPAELTIRFVDAEEGKALNREYRGKDYATNVLTFAYNEGEELGDEEPVQADIVLCTDVLQREADEQKKTVAEHVAHLVVHGVLHLAGYDHERARDAKIMEPLEVKILARLGIFNPYEIPA